MSSNLTLYGHKKNVNILGSAVFVVNFEHVLACWAI